jgi:hypothetical protein
VNSVATEFFALTKRKNYWVTVLILLPLVMQRIFIGGTSGNYADYTGVNFAFIGYIVHFILFFYLFFETSKQNDNLYFLYLSLLIFVSIFQIYNSLNILNVPFTLLALSMMRALLWVVAIYVYSTRFFDPDSFSDAFCDILKIAGIFVILCFFIYTLTGIPLGVNIEGGLARAHGTFSEPSTLSCVFPAFTFVQFQRRNFAWAAMGVLVIYVSASTIATVVFFLMIAAFAVQKWKSAEFVLIFGTILIAVFLTFALNGDVVANLDSLASSTSHALDATIGKSSFRDATLDRIPQSIQTLAQFINSASALEIEQSGGLARFVGALTMLENMSGDGTIAYGYGLSIYGVAATQLYGTVLDFGLFPFLVSSFGAIVGTMLIFLIGWRIFKWASRDFSCFLIFTGALFGTIYNSGGGIIAYSLPLIGVFAPLISRIKSAQQNQPEKLRLSAGT